MGKISAVSFIYNEAPKLDRCLSSIRDYVDEIILFDLESTDGTYEVARKYTSDVFKVPYLLCGDSYKIELASMAKNEWLLWFYGDEVFPVKTASILRKLTDKGVYTVYGFMRHEYMDDVRVAYNDGKGNVIQFGSAEAPNYQLRLIKNCPDIMYTEMVHNELEGQYSSCCLPPEYYMEHWKTSVDQEFDNIRLYLWYKFMIFKYGNTNIEPYKKHIVSYRKIVRDSEAKNLSGERKIHLAEEFWWNWQKYSKIKRLTLAEFQEVTGIPYKVFLDSASSDFDARIVVEATVRDKILDGRLESV